MKFSISISSVNVTPAALVTFTEEILNRKLHFLRGVPLGIVPNCNTFDYIVSKKLVNFGE